MASATVAVIMIALKKTALPFVLTVLASVGVSGASSAQPTLGGLPIVQPGSPITVEAVNVTNPDSSKCVYGWNATIKNSGAKDIKVVVSSDFGHLKLGETTVTVPAGKSVVASVNDIPLTEAANNGAEFMFRVKDASSNVWYGYKSTKTPMINWFGLEFSAKSTSPTSFTWSATNPSSFAYPAGDLKFQAFVSSSKSGPWTTGGGGTSGRCIPAHGSITLNPNKPVAANSAQINVLKYDLPVRREVVAITQQAVVKL